MLERIIGWLGAGSACVVAGVEGAARRGAAAGARFIEAVDAGSKLVRLLNGFWKGLSLKRAVSEEQAETRHATITDASNRGFTRSNWIVITTPTHAKHSKATGVSDEGFSLSQG